MAESPSRHPRNAGVAYQTRSGRFVQPPLRWEDECDHHDSPRGTVVGQSASQRSTETCCGSKPVFVVDAVPSPTRVYTPRFGATMDTSSWNSRPYFSVESLPSSSSLNQLLFPENHCTHNSNNNYNISKVNTDTLPHTLRRRRRVLFLEEKEVYGHDVDEYDNESFQDAYQMQASPLRRFAIRPRQRVQRIRKALRGRLRPHRASHAIKSPWLMSADHPVKILWDVLTVVLSLVNAYLTHAAIRDRAFNDNLFVRFCECWFVLDIVLNFLTEHKTSDGLVYNTVQAVWARYLTTWFVVDVLSLFPGEALYVRPIIERQNRRTWWQKSFFRTKAVIRVTKVLRSRHVRLFGSVAKRTKHAGVGAHRLLRLVIKYVPKYVLFLKHMRAVIALRVLRQVHWMRKVWRNVTAIHSVKPLFPDDDDTLSLTEGFDEPVYEDYNEDGDDLVSLNDHRQHISPSNRNDWEWMDDVDDDPF